MNTLTITSPPKNLLSQSKSILKTTTEPQKKTLLPPQDFKYSLSSVQTMDGKSEISDFSEVKVETLPIQESGEGNTQVMLIRHGTSVFNLISSQFADQTGFTFKDREAYFNFQPLLLDTQLHISGKIQAQNLGKSLIQQNKKKIHTIFVSPLKRTLQTCYNIFKNHPQKNEIKFVVFPLVSEIYSKVCDIFNSKDTFQDKELREFFDFSLVDQIWQIENIQNEELKQKIKEQLKFDEISGQCTNLEETQINFVEQHFPKSVEKYDSVFERAQKTKKYIKQYIEQNNISKDQQVVIISHNSYLRNFTASKPDDGKNGAGGLKFANCQAVLYNF